MILDDNACSILAMIYMALFIVLESNKLLLMFHTCFLYICIWLKIAWLSISLVLILNILDIRVLHLELGIGSRNLLSKHMLILLHFRVLFLSLLPNMVAALLLPSFISLVFCYILFQELREYIQKSPLSLLSIALSSVVSLVLK